jgi:hypothetical protein
MAQADLPTSLCLADAGQLRTTRVSVFVTVTQIVSASPCCHAVNAAVLAAISPEVSSHVSR